MTITGAPNVSEARPAIAGRRSDRCLSGGAVSVADVTASAGSGALAAADLPPGTPVALVVAGSTAALAWEGGSCHLTSASADAIADADALRAVAAHQPRWVWWNARETAVPLVAAG